MQFQLRGLRGSLTAALLCACAALGGCAGGFDSVYSTDFWVEPGKFEFLKCRDIAQATRNYSTQEAKLTGLMARANQGGAGPLVNVMVYQAQLQQVRSNLELLQRTAREKNCPSIVPAAKK